MRRIVTAFWLGFLSAPILLFLWMLVLELKDTKELRYA